MSLTLHEDCVLLDAAGGTLWHRAHPFAPWRWQARREDAPLSALCALVPGARSRLSLWLAGSLAQPLSLPWLEGLRGRDDWRDYACQALQETYGRSAADWHVCWRLPSFGQAAMVAGMDRALWEELRAQPLRIGAAHPLLPLVLARWRRRIARDETLVLLERDTVQWAVRGESDWRALGILPRIPGQSLPELFATLRALKVCDQAPLLLIADPDCRVLPVQALDWALPCFAQGE